MKIKSNLLSLIPLFSVLVVLLAELALVSGCKSSPRFSGLTPLTTGISRGAIPGEHGGRAGQLTQGSGEELWIIARGAEGIPEGAEDAPGSGALMAKVEGKEVPVPLKHTDVHASISAYIGAVEVAQQFQNPY